MKKHKTIFFLIGMLITSFAFAKPLFPSLIPVPLTPKDKPIQMAKADEVQEPVSRHKHHHHKYHCHSRAHIVHECD